ncbi:AraC family transcriptional regulator [Niallia taxi]|uniref:AraC family transcriptional regulator n=1 Tax=Niallia taxi TaxID=2499688 RepID=A0A437KFN2_9BACI|nr:AraC family transcriptional regulator [Niallia taxi]MCM3214650.1 AraC family transcriptional regulator [Niallia taxi]MED4056182.1 AraC family transcriptional regulator [Niallia taxi]MED4119667.1 AraC family transcriptional regulator [Niallia taxi]RVT67009.1 AraC family transcriptional regulator [Niallia taxi]
MNSAELKRKLESYNKMAPPDWNHIKNTYQVEPIGSINGEPLYEFNMIFDPFHNPIEDNIFISQCPPTAFVPLHIHQYIELIYVYQGSCQIIMQEDVIDIEEGGIIMIDKNTPHTVMETTKEDIIIEIKLKHDYLSSSFLSRFTNRSIISQFLVDSLIDSRSTNKYLYFPFEASSNFNDIMEHIMCEYFEEDAFTSGMIDAYLFIMFTELIRHSNSLTSIERNNRTEKDLIVLNLLQYIESHCKECSLTAMADQFKYHPNYISAILKKATGKSFTDLLQIQRVNKAALYLTNSFMPIPEIAEEVGYSSVSFFYKKFNEIYQQTPKEYRDSNQ